MFVFVGNSRWVACHGVQDRMLTAIMVCSTASANQTASATTCFSAATLPHLRLLIRVAVLAIAGVTVMAMGAGGLLLFGSGFSIAPQSHFLAIAGVMAMGAGGLLLFGSGFSIAPQSHVLAIAGVMAMGAGGLLLFG
jgi:hypothetical protein